MPCLGIHKLVWPTNKAPMGCVTDFYAPIWVIRFCVAYHYTIIFTEKMVLITDGQRMLWSQKVGNAFPSDVDVFLLVLWFSITHTQTHTHKDIQYTLWASRLTHPYKYIFTSPAMCSQLLYLLRWMYNSLLSKIYFPQCLLFSKIIHL